MRIVDDKKTAVTLESSACAMEGTKALVMRWRGHTPHWRRYEHRGYARAKIEWQGKPEEPALSLHCTEGYETRSGRYSEKKTMLTMDNSDARALYEFLRERFEPKQEPGEDAPNFERMPGL